MQYENAIVRAHALIADCTTNMQDELTRAVREGDLERFREADEGLLALAVFVAILRIEYERRQPLTRKLQRLTDAVYGVLAGE